MLRWPVRGRGVRDGACAFATDSAFCREWLGAGKVSWWHRFGGRGRRKVPVRVAPGGDLTQGRFMAGVYCRAGLWLRGCCSFAAGCEVPALMYFRMLCVRVGVVPLFLRWTVLRGGAADGLSRACQ